MAPKKQQKMSVGDFLTDQTLGSWADEMDSQPLTSSSTGYSASRGGYSTSSAGPMGMGGDRYGSRSGPGGFGSESSRPMREQLPLPTRPPYTTHLGNLSFEVTEGDIQDFLSACEVTSVRIVEDKMDGRPKGFAYVEFGTLDGLKKALDMNDNPLQGRSVRISVADPPKDSAREIGDWTRKGPLPDMPGQGRSSGMGGDRGGPREFNRGGFEPASDMADRGGRRPFFEDDSKQRDFANWERRGPLSPPISSAEPRQQRAPRDFAAARDQEQAAAPTGDARSESESRPVRERQVSERAPTAAESDSQWRAKMRPDAPSPAADPEADTSTPSAAAAAPASRPKLNLQKRTVSEAPSNETASATDAKASPFGAARPIDTRARDAAMDEKRQLQQKQKREAEDKVREEKKAQAAAKAEKSAAPVSADADQSDAAATKEAANANARENGGRSNRESAQPSRKNSEIASPTSSGRQYEILRRMEDNDEEGDHTRDFDGPNADANGTVIGDKETKPQETVREVSASAGGSGADTPNEPTANELEDDGFQVVDKKKKGRAGNRALAS